MKIVFALFLSVIGMGVLHAATIDELLQDYKVASDLSFDTKKEGGGSLILYTREDLEKMQVFMLRDILKNIPIFTLQEAFSGPVALARAGAASFNSQFLRLYINDHELGSVVFGSAMKMWGYMDMAYIDHVEIYQTGSAVNTGDEPPGLVIRLYTKDPKREKGALAQVMTSTQGSHAVNAYFADTSGDISYLLYASHQNEKRNSVTVGTYEVDRGLRGSNLFGKLIGKNFQIDVGRYHLKQDGLLGFGAKKTPTDAYMDLAHHYVIYTHYFQDKSLKLKFEYDFAQHERFDYDENLIVLNNDQNVTRWRFDKDEHILNTVLNKTFFLGEHTLDVGLQFKVKHYVPVSVLLDDVEYKDAVSNYNRNDIYSLFISDDWIVNRYNRFSTTIKYDHVRPNAVAKEIHGVIARAGHVFNTQSWMWKSFVYNTYGMPFFMQNSSFPFINTQDSALEPVRYMAGSTEVHYKTKHTDTSLRVIYNRVWQGIEVINKTYTNVYDTKEFMAYYASHTQTFNRNHKLSLSAYTSDTFDLAPKSSMHGALVQSFNTIGMFDVYNEFNYRSGYSARIGTAQAQVDDGLDYTVAISYQVHKDLQLALRGENLLGRAITTPYDVQGGAVYMAPFDTTVRLTMKYLY